MPARTYNSQLKKLQESPLYEKVMDDYTDRYVEELAEHAMTFSTKNFLTALETEIPIGLITGENESPYYR